MTTNRHAGEVDDQIGPLGQTNQKPVAVGGVARAHPGERLPLVEIENEEPGLASVEDPEPVTALLNSQERPCVAVDHDRVAKELGVPDRGEVGVGKVGAGDLVEEGSGVGVEQRSISVEGAILNGDRDFAVGLVRREHVIFPRRRSGQ